MIVFITAFNCHNLHYLYYGDYLPKPFCRLYSQHINFCIIHSTLTFSPQEEKVSNSVQ